jgi:hypothetical protein
MFIDMRIHPDREIQKFFQEDVRILYASLFAFLDSCGSESIGAKKFAVNVGLQVFIFKNFKRSKQKICSIASSKF